MFDYQWCPHRFYLRKVQGLPVFPTPAMVYGTGMHAAVEACGRFIAQRSPETLLSPGTVDRVAEVMQGAFDRVLTPASVDAGGAVGVSVLRRLRLEAVAGIRAFAERDIVRCLESTPVLIEAPFACDIPEANVILNGVIDRVDSVRAAAQLGSPRLVLREFKSGLQWRETGLKSLPLLQTQLYSYVVAGLTGQLPHKVVLEAIESGACRESSPSPKDQVRVVERVVDMAHNIRAGRFEATPSTMTCGLCPFQRSCSKAHQ